MAKGDLGEIIGGVVLGVVGGLALAEILARLLGYKCPKCGEPIVSGMTICPKCGTLIRRL